MINAMPTKNNRRRKGRRPRDPSRRGIVLVMIVSLLSLFALVAITYVVSATQHHRAADKISRVGRYGNDPKYILDSALYQLVCDTTNARSAIQYHGLLADMYGHYGASGTIGTCEPLAGGQLLRMRLRGDEARRDNLEFDRPLKEFGYVGGCVITMLDGPCSGLSSHIVQHDLTTLDGGNNILVYVKSFVGDDRPAIPGANDRFRINGQAFTGTGFGYNIESGRNDKTGPSGKQVASAPNFMNSFPLPAGPVTSQALVQRSVQIDDIALIGGANEEFDGPTNQDMAFAYVPDQGGEDASGRTPDPIKPSFHRTDLLQRSGGAWDADTMRKLTFRPVKQDHPSFTGSNPSFDPVRGPWDVDNDRDGVADAIWVDLGYPPQMGPDGRMVKPLFAITCMPTNGGIDINAAGNPGHLAPAGTGRTPYGMGSGPVDIDVNMLAGMGSSLYAKIANGDGSNPGKYGKDRRPGAGDDRTTRYWREKHPQFPHKWLWEPARNPRGYGSPPDFYGLLQVRLDENDGQPIWTFGVGGKGAEATPMFEINTTRDGARGGSVTLAKDPLFSHAEYERFLRQYDHDAQMLPGRLWELASELRSYPKRFCVESYDVPAPNFQVPTHLRKFAQEQLKTELNNRLARSYVDLLRARIKKGGGEPSRLIAMYCPPEMLQGLRMDLNRPFGNGKDDDNNGSIDDPYEASQGAAPGEKVEGFDGDSDLLNMDPLFQPDKTGPVNVQNLRRVRLLYCRQLYVMMMTLLAPTSEGYDFQGQNHRNMARQMAQWAVNVCDFRDPDQIMTRFVYDVNPFDSDGWVVRETDPSAVFGCERPELILTEAIAGHDRRTQDLADPGGKVDGTDVDFDQSFKPLPWMYIELYNPWNKREAVSGELYKHRNAGTFGPVTEGVILDQEMPSRNGCWRLMFHLGDEDTDNLTIPSEEGDNSRSFYFVTNAITLPADGSRNNWDFFRSQTGGGGQVAPIRPGHCAVVGMRRVTPIGPTRGGGAGNSRPVIKLNPSSNADAPDQVEVINNGGGESRPADAKPPVSVVVDQSRRGTTPGAISSPPHGYPSRVNSQVRGMSVTSTFTGTELEGSYSPPVNQPLDSRRQDVGGLLQTTAAIPGYRWCHLQRLADPTQDFHTILNPFRSIDGIPIDLFVYNSLSSDTTDPEDDGQLDFKIVSRERGETESLLPGGANNLWTQEIRNRKRKSAGDPADPWRLYHTLGWLPKPLGQAQVGGGGGTGGGGAGGKAQPYPWLTFFNRPFINPFELTMVSDARSIELLRPPIPAPGGFNMVRPNTTVDPYTLPRGDFSHLMNFFYGGPATREHPIRDLAVLLDFVGVTPQFVGTEIRLDPNQSKDLPYMRPPFFNKVSSYRIPGRTNLNFMSSQEAYHALINEVAPTGGGESESWKHFRTSRRGSTTPLGNPSEDARFDHPFRAYGGAELTSMEGGVVPKGTDVTILRRAEGRGSGQGAGLFVPLSSEGGTDDPNRSAYFRYQRLMRVGSTTTPRSNTFAIWITVGFFEVESVAKSEANPDGYRLGQEAGWDTGNVNRHRAFYIVDRSIPVACQPGKIHNVHKCIVVNRLIE